MILDFIRASNQTLFFYYLLSNLIYAFLLIAALTANALHKRRLSSLSLERLRNSPLAPPVSILVPARNEAASIVESVRSLLALDYPQLEVIVVNDGSSDGTLAELVSHFGLLETDLPYISEIPTQPVRGLYMSRDDARLVVVDKEWGHSKADTVNAGLNVASSPYFCVVDADAILERDALLRIMAPTLTDPRPIVAAGGVVRVANGSHIREGRMHEVRLPQRPVEILQVIEYLRAFMVGREGWAHFNLLLIISGAFGIFRRDLIKKLGGYRVGSVGEDLDLVVRLHRHLRERGESYHISYVPDPVCWTEVPPNLSSLARQRARWQNGLFDVLWKNRKMLFRARYGRIGWVAMPYHWLFELLAPVVELTGYTTILLAALLGVLEPSFFISFLIFGYGFATLLSVGAVLQEEITFRRYNDWRDVIRLLCFCLLEHFPYRQLQMIFRLRGMWQYLRGDFAWGRLKRVGLGAQPTG